MYTVPIYSLVYAMTAWIGTTGIVDMPATERTPHVRAVPTELVADEVARCLHLADADPLPRQHRLALAEDLQGLYCNHRVTINSDNTDLSTVDGQMVLVHELVHWLQELNGDRAAAPCVRALEADAYRVGWEWQARFGLPREPNEFTVVMRSTCSAENQP